MKRLESLEDEIKGIVTYELPDGRHVCFEARSVREHGISVMMRANGLEQFIPTERIPVFQYGHHIGTMAPDFDPASVRSNSFLYDPRPSDFRREGDTWVACNALSVGDIDCVVGFKRETAKLFATVEHLLKALIV